MADVAGSVQLYEQLGDEKAHEKISHCLQLMSKLIDENHGTVAETIGDEILCIFERAEDAVEAACHIHEQLSKEEQSSVGVKIGIHSGNTGVQNGHPFGDTVNVAARMVALAKNGQVILSQQVYERLPDLCQAKIRYFDNVYIKGKQKPYVIYEAVWNTDESTVMIPKGTPIISKERRKKINVLHIRYQSTDKTIAQGNADFLLGRGKQCSLVVDSKAASRVHAIFGFHGGKLILSDRSTNGTFVEIQSGNRHSDGKNLFIHREEWNVEWNGIISLGEPISVDSSDLIHFSCIY